MSDNGSGVYQVNSAGQPVAPTTTISSSVFNAFTADVATALSNRICKDGQSTVTADIPLGNNKLTGVKDGSALADAATIKNIQNGTGVYVATVGGTADAIELTPAPAITAYVAGQTFSWIAIGANTTVSTVAISGLVAKSIKKYGTTALVAGDIASGALLTIRYDGTNFQLAAPVSLPVSGGTLTGLLTTNGQVAFPASQNASADANTLDDYEEGLWTPSLGGSTTYTTQIGTYVKIGKKVSVKCFLVINAIGTGSTDTIGGLPFTCAAGADGVLAVGDFSDLASSVVWIGARVNAASTDIVVRSLTAAGTAPGGNAIFKNAALISLSGFYFV